MKKTKTPRAYIRVINKAEDLDWFASKSGWALLDRSECPPELYPSPEFPKGCNLETYLTPAGIDVSFVVFPDGKVEFETKQTLQAI